jgi:hypothetical protein
MPAPFDSSRVGYLTGDIELATTSLVNRKGVAVGIGVSVFLIAIGAILSFAITADAEGFNINTIGWILMIVGAIGLLASLIFAGSLGAGRREERVVERDIDPGV